MLLIDVKAGERMYRLREQYAGRRIVKSVLLI